MLHLPAQDSLRWAFAALDGEVELSFNCQSLFIGMFICTKSNNDRKITIIIKNVEMLIIMLSKLSTQQYNTHYKT